MSDQDKSVPHQPERTVTETPFHPLESPLDIDLFYYSEVGIVEAIQGLGWDELSASNPMIVGQLQTKLSIILPTISWRDQRVQYKRTSDGSEMFLWVKVHDPNLVLPFVRWPRQADDYSPNSEKGSLTVSVSLSNMAPEGAWCVFQDRLSEYKQNLPTAAVEIERFNHAVPYLISAYADQRRMTQQVFWTSRRMTYVH